MVATNAVVFCVLAVVVSCCLADESCYASNKDPYHYHASKTAYEFVKDSSIPEGIADCEPVQVWIFSRHGTRYPDEGEIKEMDDLHALRDEILSNHEKRKGSLCDADLVNLQRWTLDVASEQGNKLTLQGHMDLEHIADRIKLRYPELMTETYDADTFNFRYTNTQRTRASAEAFAMGLFGGVEGSIPLPAPIDNDTLIEAFTNCTAWLDEVDNAPHVEQELWKDGPQYLKMVKDVSDRLGFKDKLKKGQVNLMYDMCRYDQAWAVNQVSPWCAAFNKTDLMILEYAQDLKYYYGEGYGNEMNVKLGCPPVRDLMQRFSKLVDNDISTQPNGVFYFSHSTAIKNTLCALGIARDDIAPTHSNYELMQDRKWRVSMIGSFASNLAAVFFNCSKGDPHRVMFFLEEAVLPYEGCDAGVCSWAFLKDKFSHVAQECDLSWCSKSSRSERARGRRSSRR